MKRRILKKRIKGAIVHLLDGFDLFKRLNWKDIRISKTDYTDNGYCLVQGIPFRYKARVKDGRLVYFQLHVALEEYYKQHVGDDSDSVQQMKKDLSKLDTILITRVAGEEVDDDN